MGRKLLTLLGPLYGFLFLSAYVRSASADVVYTDYIRLVNSYLADVTSFKPYLHGDILTRIPANYPERILNVALFRYSTMFEMLLGCFFLALSAAVAARYCRKKEVSLPMTGLLLLFLFSLNKWEMLTNGSGWVHFAAFALFWHHYYVFDRVMSGAPRPWDRRQLYLLPWITILFFGGPYGGVYAVTLLLADGFFLLFLNKGTRRAQAVGRDVAGADQTDGSGINSEAVQTGGSGTGSEADQVDGQAVVRVPRDGIWNDPRENVRRMLCALLPLLLYLVSRALSVEERAGATTEPLSAVVRSHPGLLPSLFVRSFSSMVIGAEAGEVLGVTRALSIALGLLVLAFYVWAFLINFRGRLYERTSFPLFLLTAGFLNHVLITLSRWIFLKDSYGMSSRYALQFQVGIAGILLSFAMAEKTKARTRAMQFFAALLLIGTLLTTGREIHMAKYRQEHFTAMQEAALDYENRSDEELVQVLQYHDPARIRSALKILEDRNLNVFRDGAGAAEAAGAANGAATP